MTKNELLKILDIDDGFEFGYFENLADLLEYDGEITADALYPLLMEIDASVFSEISESYFDDLIDHLPDTDVDIYNILEAEKRVFTDLAGRKGDDEEDGRESSLRKLADEIERFREWYSLSPNCVCTDPDTGESETLPLRDAAARYRLAKLDGKDLGIDFDEALGFEVEDYIVSFGELAEGASSEDQA